MKVLKKNIFLSKKYIYTLLANFYSEFTFYTTALKINCSLILVDQIKVNL